MANLNDCSLPTYLHPRTFGDMTAYRDRLEAAFGGEVCVPLGSLVDALVDAAMRQHAVPQDSGRRAA